MKKTIALLAAFTVLVVAGVAYADDPDGDIQAARDLLAQADALLAQEQAKPPVVNTVTETVTLPPSTVTETVTETVTQTPTTTTVPPTTTTTTTTVPPTTPPPPAPGFPSRAEALARSSVVAVSGARSTQYRVGSPPPDTTYDLRGMTSTAYPNGHAFPVSIGRDTAGARTVVVGGAVFGTQPRDFTWDQVHAFGGAGMTLRGVDYQVSYDFRADNQHDGIQVLPGGTTKYLIEGAHMTWIRDDAIENDTEFSGVIRDVLVESANNAISIGQSTKNSSAVNTVEDSIFILVPMRNDRAADGIGHQALFKQAPGGRVNLRNVIVCLTENPMTTDRQTIWPAGDKENVRIVLGADYVGSYPGTLPSGVTVSRDWSICTDARDAWLAAH